MKKLALIVLISIFISPCIAAEKYVIQLKWFHQFQFAGYYMAEKKGYYLDAGIKVDIREGGPSIDVSKEVLSGAAHFGVLGSELLLHRAESREVVVLAPIMQHSIRAVFADKSKGINYLSDLAGQQLMLNISELPEFMAMFKNEGIPFESLMVESKSSDANRLFLEGRIAGLNGSIANQPYTFESAGKDFITFRPLTYGIDFYGDTLFTTESLAYGETKLVNDFLNASLKGWKYAFDNPEETIRVIIEDYNSSKKSDHLYYEFEKLKSLIAPELVQIGHNNPERWKHIEAVYKDLNMISGQIDLDGFFFNPDYKSELIYKVALWILAALLVLFISFLIITFIANRRLSRTVFLKSAQLASAIESMPVLIIGIDCSYRITLWNQRAEHITGRGEDIAIGKSVFEILPYLLKIKDKIEKNLREGTAYRDMRQLFFEGNKSIYRDISLYPLATDKKNCAVLKIEDVTNQVEMTESLAQNEKLMSLGRMAAGLAHEVNNPLAGIIQSTAVMSNRLIKKTDSKINLSYAEKAELPIEAMDKYLKMREIPKLIDNIEESTKRITKIIDNFLTYSRKASVVPEVFSIQDLIESTLELASIEYNLKTDYDFSDIEIMRDYEHNLPEIESYKSKLQQVLLNILRNGAQEMHLSGTKNPRFTIDVKFNESSGFRIAIKDNGPGITEEIQNRIFDPFFTTKEMGKGTGLGLSMSYYLIHDFLKGRLSVESEPGKGAMFIIELPGKNISEPEYCI